MKRIFLILLLFPTLAFAQHGEIYTSGRTDLIVQDEGTTIAEAPYMNFTGAGVTATTSGGKMIISISSGTGSIATIGDCTGPSCFVTGGHITVDTINVASFDSVVAIFADPSPTTNIAGEIGFDTNAFGNRGAMQVFDNTAVTYLLGMLASDDPNDNESPVWHSGGTTTWEPITSDTVINGTDTYVLFFDGANNPSGSSKMTFNKTTGALTVTSVETAPSANPSSKRYDSNTPDGDINGQDDLNCPTTISGGENCEWTFGRQVAGVMTNSLILGNTGGVTMDTVTITTGITATDLIDHSDIADSDQECSGGIWFENPTAADDFKSIWPNKGANDCQLTEMWGESDQTVNFTLLVDDGTPAPINGNLAPAAGEAEDISLTGDTVVAADEELDLQINSVTNSPTWVSIKWTGNWVD